MSNETEKKCTGCGSSGVKPLHVSVKQKRSTLEKVLLLLWYFVFTIIMVEVFGTLSTAGMVAFSTMWLAVYLGD